MGYKILGYISLVISIALIFLVNIFESFGYTLLFLAFFTLFASLYFLSFAYPKRRIITTIIFTILAPMFLYIVSKSYAISGIYYIMSLRNLLISGIIISFVISLFISKIIFAIDSERKSLGKSSILIKPVVISLVYFFIFSTLNVLQTFIFSYQSTNLTEWNLTKTPLEWSMGVALGDFLPLIFAFIPLFIAIFLTWFFYYITKNMKESRNFFKNISFVLFIILSIIFVLGFGFYPYSIIVNIGNATLDIFKTLSFISFLISPIVLLFYLMIRE